MAETLYISPSEVRFSGGKFDSDYRYIRGNVAASSTSFPMVRGQTIEVRKSQAYQGSGALTRYAPNWRYDNTVTALEYDEAEDGPSSFSASATTVDL